MDASEQVNKGTRAGGEQGWVRNHKARQLLGGYYFDFSLFT